MRSSALVPTIRLAERFRSSLLAVLVLATLHVAGAPELVRISYAQVNEDCNANGIADEKDADGDGDGIPDACDVCPLDRNPGQEDSDLDGIGDLCDPDVNNDGGVGIPDFARFRVGFNSRLGDSNYNPALDFNSDGGIGIPDFNILRRFFGGPPGPGKLPVSLIRGYIAARVAQRDPNPNDPSTSGKPLNRDVYLPNVGVYLVELISGVESGRTATDLSGRFTLMPRYPGRYRVCWEGRGIIEDCTDEIYPVGSDNLHVSKLLVALDRRAGPIVYGEVAMGDGSPPRMFAPLAGINSFAYVELLGEAGDRLDQVYVNNFGEYVLRGVPTNEDITLVAHVEGEARKQPLRGGPDGANLAGASAHEIDLRVLNTPPKLRPLIPMDGGKSIEKAEPGTTIQLTADATDPERDALRYRWVVGEGHGSVDDPTARTVNWKLPAAESGTYNVSVHAYDGKGGYDSASYSLEVNKRGTSFSGRVSGTDITALAGVEVEVNGKLVARTGSDGRFTTTADPADDYIVNFRKFGYGLVSKIYLNGVVGGRWQLPRATVRTVDPSRPIDVRHQSDERDCPGQRAWQLAWDGFPGSAEPQWQDGKGNVIAAPPDESKRIRPIVPGVGRRPDRGNCGAPARVQIPADALVDGNGNPPPGMVNVSLSRFDLRSGQMPGDFTARTAGGDQQVMESWGAINVNIRDAARTYNLKPGSLANVTIPVDPAQLVAPAPLPPTIPLLFYNASTGVWEEEGTLNLVGDTYQSLVPHFSEINADELKVDQACVAIFSPSLPSSYKIEVLIPRGNAAPKLLTGDINNAVSQEHVIYNLPDQTTIVITPYRVDDDTPIGNFIVETGGKQVPTDPNKPEGPPYYTEDGGGNPLGPCSTQVVLQDIVIPDAPSTEAFLHGLYTFAATDVTELQSGSPADQALATALATATDDYYHEIDPCGRRATLGGFRSTNGFGGAGEIVAKFSNSGDLGFGRDMHCVRNVDDVACYVTNYGTILTDDEQDVANTADDVNPGATVAMEYTRIENAAACELDPNDIVLDDAERVVKFYVYVGDGGVADANDDGAVLANAADLDSGADPAFNDPPIRARPIPQLCMVCHGGEFPSTPAADVVAGDIPPVEDGAVPVFDSRESVKLGSQFLPFDLRFYGFVAEEEADIDLVAHPTWAGRSKEGQQDDFKDLNEEIVLNTNPHATISEVITDMYVNFGVTNEQDEDFAVSGWNTTDGATVLEENLYKDVLAPTCRTCHIAHAFPVLRFDESNDPGPELGFIDRLGQVETRVCSEHVMPHAEATHDIFWGSLGPAMPGLLQLFGDSFGNVGNGWSGTLCGDYTPGGDTPISVYEQDIVPIWQGLDGGTTACTVCHSGAAQLPNLGGGAASHGNIVNVPAPSGGGLDFIEPNSVGNSFLHQAITGNPGLLGQMPLGGAALDAGAIQTIEDWINAGAPN